MSWTLLLDALNMCMLHDCACIYIYRIYTQLEKPHKIFETYLGNKVFHCGLGWEWELSSEVTTFHKSLSRHVYIYKTDQNSICVKFLRNTRLGCTLLGAITCHPPSRHLSPGRISYFLPLSYFSNGFKPPTSWDLST